MRSPSTRSRELEGAGQALRDQSKDRRHKWKARSSVSDLPTGPKQPRSTVLSAEEEDFEFCVALKAKLCRRIRMGGP